mmetsp:Transcript_13316/g.20280  ORF Transcript_13316/g.20280 Transcript_13316/m.20280 type:complete len:721 (-) Transcript_13316:427-2589(-)
MKALQSHLLGTLLLRLLPFSLCLLIYWRKRCVIGKDEGNSSKQRLFPRAFIPSRVGTVTPYGWLGDQLDLQAAGLSGHLSEFWTDVMDSVWIGGSGDGGLHERTPYWLNGIVPLAALLENKIEPSAISINTHVNITAQVEKYIQHILLHQTFDGWLGPDDYYIGKIISLQEQDPYWGPTPILLALCQYAESKLAKGDHQGWNRGIKAVRDHLLEQKRRMESPSYSNLTSWSKARWIDIVVSVEWLLDHDSNLTQKDEKNLFEMIPLLKSQGLDWDTWFQVFSDSTGENYGHNVNNAQALKSAAVWYRYSGSTRNTYLSLNRMQNLDERYGLPTGMFNGDEILPSSPDRNPSRGIELCGVVEAMYSYATMFSIHGVPDFADRVERIAYNALPATWASPKGGDMWAHQYLQAVNEINAIKADPHAWEADGPMAETYGLEPNYGCCTANFHQGWPKLAYHTIFWKSNGGVVVGIWAPVSATNPQTGVFVNVSTNYPFDDHATVSVTVPTNSSAASLHEDFPVFLRIPKWAHSATVDGSKVKSGSMWKGLAITGDTTHFDVHFHPSIRVEQWDNGAVSIHRGALMYSLPITANYTIYGHHFGTAEMSNDYYLYPTSKWEYAIDIDDLDQPEKSLRFIRRSSHPSAAPFNHTNWCVVIQAQVRPIFTWGIDKNSAAPPPSSPACTKDPSVCGEPKTVLLVPHGGTDLRIGELPLSGMHSSEASFV